jgi:hypothetical protein
MDEFEVDDYILHVRQLFQEKGLGELHFSETGQSSESINTLLSCECCKYRVDSLFDFARCLYSNIPENSPLKIKILTMVAIYCTEVILNIDFEAFRHQISEEFLAFRKKFVTLLDTVLERLELENETPEEVMLVNAQLNFRRITFAQDKIKVLEEFVSDDESIIEMMLVLRNFIIIHCEYILKVTPTLSYGAKHFLLKEVINCLVKNQKNAQSLSDNNDVDYFESLLKSPYLLRSNQTFQAHYEYLLQKYVNLEPSKLSVNQPTDFFKSSRYHAQLSESDAFKII